MDFEEFRLLGVEAQRKAFAELTKSEQYDVYRSFEEFHQPFVDGFYKDQLGQVMYREGTVEHDGYRDWETDRKSTRLNSSHRSLSRMPSSA